MRISAKVVAAMIAVVAVPTITVIIATVVCHGITSGECVDASWSLPSHAVYTGSVTLIGLATFGSVIGARVLVGKNKEAEYIGAMLMVVGSFGVIVAQGIVMMYACCGDADQTTLCILTPVTVICSLLIVGGFAYILEELFRSGSKNRDEGQPSAQDGTQDGGQSGAPDGTDTELHFRFKSGQGTGDEP